MNQQGSDLFKVLVKVLYLAAALVVVLWFLYLIEPVVLASLLALIFAMALNAPVSWLEQKNVSRPVGTVLVFFGLLAVTVPVGWLVGPRLAEEIPVLIEQVPELIQNLTAQITDVVGDHPEVQRQMSQLVDWAFGLFEGLWQYVDVVAGAFAFAIFVVALMLYMVANLRPLLRWYVKSMPPRLRDAATEAFSRASRMVIGWVIASVFLGGIKAVAALAFLSFMQVPGALVWSVLAFFGAFVPRVGFYVMAIPPVLVALTLGPLVALWTFLFFWGFSELLGNFVAPRIYAETMEINAVFILFMTVAMGYAFGLIGVLIATPVAGFVKAYYDEFYLKRQPAVSNLEERVEAMIERDHYGAERRPP